MSSEITAAPGPEALPESTWNCGRRYRRQPDCFAVLVVGREQLARERDIGLDHGDRVGRHAGRQGKGIVGRDRGRSRRHLVEGIVAHSQRAARQRHEGAVQDLRIGDRRAVVEPQAGDGAGRDLAVDAEVAGPCRHVVMAQGVGIARDGEQAGAEQRLELGRIERQPDRAVGGGGDIARIGGRLQRRPAADDAGDGGRGRGIERGVGAVGRPDRRLVGQGRLTLAP